MYLLVKKLYSHTKCSCIKVRVSSVESLFAHEEKKKYINERVFTNEESLFTCEDKCVCSCINVCAFTSEKTLFIREEKIV